MSRKTKLILLATLIILIGLTLAVFNDTIRAKMFFFYPLTPASPSDRGLVTYLPLDGNALDKSGNGRNGTVTGTTAYVAGKVGSAFDFSSTYIESPWPLTGASKGSISLWFNADTASGLTTIANSIMGNASAFGFYLNSSTLTADVVLTTKGRYAITSGISTGTWYNAVLTYDGTTIKMYLNGAFVGSQQDGFTSNTIVSFTSTTLGERITNYDFPFDGKIDDVRIYDRALSADEIKQYYDATSAGHYLTGSPGRPNSSAPVNSTLTNGLVGQWTFDGADTPWTSATAATTLDKSGNANTGTLTNMTQSSAPAPGVFGQGLKFDGANGYINITDSNSLDLTTAASISLWLKANAFNQAALSGLVRRAANSYFLGVYSAAVGNGANARKITWGSNAVDETLSATQLSANTWYHLVVIRNSGNDSIYLNGVLDNTGTGKANFTALATDIQIGISVGNGTIFDGVMDDVRVYNRVLSASEVQQLYNLGAKNKITANSGAAVNNVLTGGLVGHWTFDGPNMLTNVADISGSGNNGGLLGSATSTVVTPGIFGQGLKFDGVDDYVSVEANSSWQTSLISYGGWIRAVGTANNPRVLSSDNPGTTLKGFYVGMMSNDRSVYYGVGNGGFKDSSYILPLNEWHYLFVTYDGTNANLYVDGVFKDSDPVTSLTHTASNKLAIGVSQNLEANTFWVGQIDDVRVYNRALSAGEVQQLYNLGR